MLVKEIIEMSKALRDLVAHEVARPVVEKAFSHGFYQGRVNLFFFFYFPFVLLSLFTTQCQKKKKTFKSVVF